MHSPLSILLITLFISVASQGAEISAPQSPTGIPPQPHNTQLAQKLISPYEVDYIATWDTGWFPITIDAKRELIQTEQGWRVSFEAYSRVADVSEHSNFTLDGFTVKPHSYRFKTSGFLSKKIRNMEIHWDEQKVFLPYLKKFATFDFPNNLQDSISYQEQVRLQLMQGETDFSYSVSYKDRIRQAQFKVVKEETLKLNGKTLETVMVEQINRRHKKEFTRIWFAKNYEYLLVKLHMSDKHGDTTLVKMDHGILGGEEVKGRP